MAEGPLVSAAINRLPDEVVMLAAFGIVISLAVLIESPIINLLATRTYGKNVDVGGSRCNSRGR